MDEKVPTYEELQTRLAEAEAMLKAVSSESVDAVVGKSGVYLLRLNEMEKALKESEQKFRKAFENAAVGFVLTTPEGGFVEANAAFCAITGYDRPALNACDVRQLIHPDDYAANMRLVNHMLSGRIPHFTIENRYVCKAGEPVWVRQSISLVHDSEGLPQWIIALVEDISERKRTEASLAHSLSIIERGELTLETLLETVPEGITIAAAPEVRILQVSRYGKALLGKTDESLESIALRDHVERWDIYEADGKRRAQAEHLPLTRAVQKGEIVENEEWVFGHADGHHIPVLCNAAPIVDRSRTIIGGVVTWRDITRLKKLEKELRESNQELTEYAHALTHNIKAPFRAVQNYTDFLLEDLGDALEGGPKQYLEGLRKAVRQAHRQFQDLEALYRLRNHVLQFEAIDMKALIDEIAPATQMTADRQVRLAEDWPKLWGEGFLLRQILTELINNGLKYNRSETKTVEIGWQTTIDKQCEIIVRDNGIGIDPQYHERIFQIFKRLHTEDEYEGTGIGLSIVRRAVKKLGGDLRVESVPDEGSTFGVRLPAAIMEDDPTGSP